MQTQRKGRSLGLFIGVTVEDGEGDLSACHVGVAQHLREGGVILACAYIEYALSGACLLDLYEVAASGEVGVVAARDP